MRAEFLTNPRHISSYTNVFLIQLLHKWEGRENKADGLSYKSGKDLKTSWRMLLIATAHRVHFASICICPRVFQFSVTDSYISYKMTLRDNYQKLKHWRHGNRKLTEEAMEFPKSTIEMEETTTSTFFQLHMLLHHYTLVKAERCEIEACA